MCLGFLHGESCHGVVKCGRVLVEVCSESGPVIGDVSKGFITSNPHSQCREKTIKRLLHFRHGVISLLSFTVHFMYSVVQFVQRCYSGVQRQTKAGHGQGGTCCPGYSSYISNDSIGCSYSSAGQAIGDKANHPNCSLCDV